MRAHPNDDDEPDDGHPDASMMILAGKVDHLNEVGKVSDRGCLMHEGMSDHDQDAHYGGRSLIKVEMPPFIPVPMLNLRDQGWHG